MFRHRGKARTFKHNFRLATFLSFTAGLVNICGVLALGVLTTNVTGHFAYFAATLLKDYDLSAFYYLLYILAFLFGSFVSSFITEYFVSKGKDSPHAAAMLLEITLLLFMGTFGKSLINVGCSIPLLACILLFAMGLQNSLVSKISNSVVRTTHLTGLFTDMGIELSQLFFYKQEEQRKKLLDSIGLRTAIIVSFFLGCITGGCMYLYIQLKVLVIAAVILVVALIYDNLLFVYYKIRKQSKGK